MKKVAIHQPNFIPWIGYFHKISLVDHFVFFDNVQFPRGKTFGNRVKIKTNNGELWLTVPVLSKSDLSGFNVIQINNSIPWRRKMIKTIELSYKKARYFEMYHEGISRIILTDYERLIDLNTELIRFIAQMLKFNVKFSLASEILKDTETSADEQIILILKKLEAAVYVSGRGAGSARYIDENRFNSEKIELQWQNFSPPIYAQLWGPFIQGLSIIDLLFNCGDESNRIMTMGHKEPESNS